MDEHLEKTFFLLDFGKDINTSIMSYLEPQYWFGIQIQGFQILKLLGSIIHSQETFPEVQFYKQMALKFPETKLNLSSKGPKFLSTLD